VLKKKGFEILLIVDPIDEYTNSKDLRAKSSSEFPKKVWNSKRLRRRLARLKQPVCRPVYHRQGCPG
jgi:hypothetical protein